MIHNPSVNEDLKQRGIKFIREHDGKTDYTMGIFKKDDIVIVPAFGTTLEIQETLKNEALILTFMIPHARSLKKYGTGQNL